MLSSIPEAVLQVPRWGDVLKRHSWCAEVHDLRQCVEL
jgi:hypothetical protein